MIALLVLSLFLFSTAHGAFNYIGCYANTGVSLAFRNTYPSSPVGQCSALCSQNKYIGVIDGAQCYCGDSVPLSSPVSDANCNSNCTGLDGNCGGSSFYAVYNNPALSSSSSSLLSSSATSSSFSSSSSSSSASSSDTITVSPSSSFSVSSTALLLNSSTTLPSSTSSLYSNTLTYSHSHSSASTSIASDLTVVTSNSEYVKDGVTITSQVQLTTRKADVEVTQTADNVVSSSVVVNGRAESIKSQVAGGVVGAAAGISMICFLVWYYTRRVKQKDEEEKQRNLATIAATMGVKNELSASGTLRGTTSNGNPFDRGNTVGSKPSTKRRIGSPDSDAFQFYDAQQQHIMRMGSTGRESVAPPVMRMGSNGHDSVVNFGSMMGVIAEDNRDAASSTVGSFNSADSDGYYAQKMQDAGILSRNASSSSGKSDSRYSFTSFSSGKIHIDEDLERDDGSVHEYSGPATFGLTIANPDQDSDDEENNDQKKLRVLF